MDSDLKDTEILEVSKQVISAEIRGLRELQDTLNDNFIAAIKLLISATGRIVVSGMGKSGHISRKFASTLSSTGTPAYFIHPAEASHGDLGMIAPNDIVILLSNSGATAELDAIINYCKKYDIKIIGITRRANSTLYNISDIPLLLPNTQEASPINAPTTSATMMMVLGDAIAIFLQHYKNFDSEDFKVLHPAGNIGNQLLKVKELMHTGEDIPIINYKDSGADLILTMTEKRFGCCGLVNDNKELIGIVTDGDLRRNVHIDLMSLSVQHVMTKMPVVIDKEDYAFHAMSKMRKKKITVLFVIENRIPIGILHLHDLLRIGIE